MDLAIALLSMTPALINAGTWWLERTIDSPALKGRGEQISRCRKPWRLVIYE
jgi:hypothetical protein